MQSSVALTGTFLLLLFTFRFRPSVFILKPGQMVHINKGRLHAFRKLSTSPLKNDDCHHVLRQQLVGSIVNSEQLCFSIAWDWVFKGVTNEGINAEISSCLECSSLNRDQQVQSLASPETALLFLAKENIAKHKSASTHDSKSLIHCRPTPVLNMHGFGPSPITVLSAIHGPLKGLVQRHEEAMEYGRRQANGEHANLSIEGTPNTWQDLNEFSVDPYGADGFICKICNGELSNIYMHCDGCEKLLSRDFNICSDCHQERHYENNYQMLPCGTACAWNSVLSHTGSLHGTSKPGSCPCPNGSPCPKCEFCTSCSCQCHKKFTLNCRFMRIEDERYILEEVQKIVATSMLE